MKKSLEEFFFYLSDLDIKLWVEGVSGSPSQEARLRCSAPKNTLTPDLKAELAERKAEILAFISKANFSSSSTQDAIQPVLREGNLPLSFAQQRLWFIDQFEPNSSLYNIPTALYLRGSLNIATLEQTLNEIVRRHEALRTTFASMEGQPLQVIIPTLTLTLPIINLQELPEVEREAEVLRLVNNEAQRPFNLTQTPLLRATLLHLSEVEYVMIFIIHHIVSDGWSIGVLVRELTALYKVFSEDQPSSLPKLPIQYADFAAWQRQWLQGEVLETQLSYWRQQLDGAPAVLELPTDHPRPAVQTFRGATCSFKLPQESSLALKTLSQQEESSLFMTLLAAFKTLLFRYTGFEDIVVGSFIANRNREEIEGLIGFFVNTLVLRTSLEGNPTFRELLSRVREVALGAYAHQDVPFERLVEELEPERSLNHMPLFQVMFVLQNTPRSEIELPGLTLRSLESNSGTAKFDLSLYMTETEEGLIGNLEYSTELFEAPTIHRMVEHFQTLLDNILANPEQRLSELPLLAEPEQQTLLVEWNNTQTDYPLNQCIHELFEAQVEQTPDAIAMVYENEHLTYRELNIRANRLAHHLRSAKLSRSDSLGVAPVLLVGICTDRSLEMAVGILGILKAGGAYVPLDPAYPPSRLAFILSDAQIPVLLTQKWRVAGLPKHQAQVVCLDSDWEGNAKERSENPVSRVCPSNLAYVIYTSGSTGIPKGVLGSHAGMVNVLHWLWQTYPFQPGEVCCQKTASNFIDSIWEFFAPLLQGVPTVVIPDSVVKDPQRLILTLTQHQVRRLVLVPSLLRAILDSYQPQEMPSVQLWFTSGEALSIDLVQRFRKLMPGRELVNFYGSSEVSANATWYDTSQLGIIDISVPIGRPIANTQVYVLDPYQQPVPVGVVGELYVGGEGLARGYLNRLELTQQRFIELCLSNQQLVRLYKTGDLVRFLPNGNLEFCGRVDHQVKLRGIRIELGEIETALNNHPLVKETVVTVREEIPDDERLIAYVVTNQLQLDSHQQLPEKEWQTEQVLQWQKVWDQTYSLPLPSEDPKFNITGWNSSYTGLPLSAEEMGEWVEWTVERIRSQKPTRVLEIGCGVGLLLLRIAPYCSQYWGTDVSLIALNYLQQILEQSQPLAHVNLLQKTAPDFEGLEASALDAVILNSVVQYFPSIDYLLSVLEGAVRIVQPGGFIFIGDVRSLPLLNALHASVELHQSSSSLPTDQLQQRVQKRLAQEEELVIDPVFFNALQQHLPQIAHVQIQPKRGLHLNEMTKFRYDVTLYIGDNIAICNEIIPWLDWHQQELTLPSVRQLLLETKPETLAIANVPNARVLADVKTVELLSSDHKLQTAGDIQIALGEMDYKSAVDPEQLWNLSRELPYSVHINWSNTNALGNYDVVFQRCSSAQPSALPLTNLSFGHSKVRRKSWSSYANNPMQGKFHRQLVPQLRNDLQQKLPEYMMPSNFMMLNTLPLLPNGKVDRRSLPAPENLRPQLEVDYQPPRNEVEQTIANIWQEVLHVEEVGINDNFFELGGHSLLLVQVHSKIQTIFQQDFSLVEMFQYPTINHLAKYFSQESSKQASFEQHSQLPESRTASIQRRKQARKEHRSATNQKNLN